MSRADGRPARTQGSGKTQFSHAGASPARENRIFACGRLSRLHKKIKNRNKKKEKQNPNSNLPPPFYRGPPHPAPPRIRRRPRAEEALLADLQGGINSHRSRRRADSPTHGDFHARHRHRRTSRSAGRPPHQIPARVAAPAQPPPAEARTASSHVHTLSLLAIRRTPCIPPPDRKGGREARLAIAAFFPPHWRGRVSPDFGNRNLQSLSDNPDRSWYTHT